MSMNFKSSNIRNEYFVLRHGQSRANTGEIIVSSLEEGVKEEYTLTSEGEAQVRNSVEKAKTDGWLGRDTIIYSSPFSRCKKTAEIAKEILKTDGDIIFDDRLRERWFGSWEKTHHSNYQKVWNKDKNNPEHKENSVESASDVWRRMISFIDDLEKKCQRRKILLVSHGDSLQILLTAFKNTSPAMHRELEHINTAEIRKLE